jgi:hypothetical protein
MVLLGGIQISSFPHWLDLSSLSVPVLWEFHQESLCWREITLKKNKPKPFLYHLSHAPAQEKEIYMCVCI